MAQTPAGTGVRQVTISQEYDGQRLDNFLMRELKGVPRTLVYRIIRKGEVRVNRGRVQPSHKLSAGDVVRVPPVRAAVPGQPPSESYARRVLGHILLEDDRLMVVDKPSGMASHGGSGVSFGLIELMRAARPELPYLELVHRLDRDTSGCMILAKRRSALRALHEQLREGRVDKHYLALVKGHWDYGTRRVELALATHTRQGGERHVTVDASGKYALSIFRPVQTSRAASLVEVKIGTGRTHQIRVHAAAMEHPIAADPKYGDEAWNKEIALLGLKRLFLHATAVSFDHPKTGESVLVNAPLPDELYVPMERILAARR
jgi:23S rRNA pseudouridine955/2504/2580 synthase